MRTHDHILYYSTLQPTNTTTTTSSAIDLTYGRAIKQWMYLAKIDSETLVMVRPPEGDSEEEYRTGKKLCLIVYDWKEIIFGGFPSKQKN